MNDKLNNNVTIIPPFKRFCMTIGELPTSYLESMTYYECLVWLCNYLSKTVIPAINENGAAVTELQEKYVELKQYVDDYFENLDVQTEIDNKLDDMVEQGTLQEIIGEYLNATAVWGFDTVSDMLSATNLIEGSYARTCGYSSVNDGAGALYKIRAVEAGDNVDGVRIIEISNELVAEMIIENEIKGFDTVSDMLNATNLINGSFARTAGYYSLNDGGGALYKIRNVTVDDDVDGSFLLEYTDTLVAEMIIDTAVNIKSLGARSQSVDGTKYDIKSYLDKYINKIKNMANRFKLIIPAGIWYSTSCDLTNDYGFDIEGEYAYYPYGVDGTVITTLNNNQQYLINIGTNVNEVYTKDYSLKNIMFSTYDYAYDSTDKKFKKSTPKSVSKCVVNMLYAIHGVTDNLVFENVIGECLRITACWENKFEYLVFRYVSNPLGDIVSFRGDQSYGEYASISANEFTNMFFESTHGNLIGLYSHSQMANNHFGSINFEPAEMNYNSEFTYTSSATLPASLTHLAMIKLHESGTNFYSNTIDEINTNGLPIKYYTYNGVNYIYDRIFETGPSYIFFGTTVGNIINSGGNQPITILKNDSTNQLYASNYLNIGYIQTSENSSFKFDLAKNFSQLSYNGSLNKVSEKRVKTGEAIKLYKMLTQNTTQASLYTQDDSIFDDNICVQFPRYVSDYQVYTVATGTTLYLLAKIPNGEECTFRYGDPAPATGGNNVVLTGTGEFKWYSIDISSAVAIGQDLHFKVAASNVPDGCYFDSYFMV